MKIWRINVPEEDKDTIWPPREGSSEEVAELIIKHNLWLLLPREKGYYPMVAPLNDYGRIRLNGNSFYYAVLIDEDEFII